MRVFLSTTFLLASCSAAVAESAAVAVAANFLPVVERMSTAFADETGHELQIAHGSSGRLYAQIVAGGPFDVFLSADAERPRTWPRRV